ncbi:MAG: death on curing protein [Segetibacter sp.]|nr:death on curing protein [Segetibacter sp.]
MISINQALKIHTIAIEKFGGANGIRDMGGLESALARPFQTFAGEDLYPTIFEKAAAVGESLIMNHPFIDGNKRSGFLLMEALLRYEGYKINASDESLYNFVINISTGSISFEEIVEWLRNNTKAK